MGLIALCGLAYGYQKHFHQEAFKKGGVLGLTGVTIGFLSPGGAIGILMAIVAVIYLNKKLKVDRPIETQVKEIFWEIRRGSFFRDIRKSWGKFESFLQKLFQKPLLVENSSLL